jgi:hypothetical protein
MEPMQSLETPVHSTQKKVVLKAIEDSGPTITPADISLKTGLPVLTSTALLNQIAYETGGHLKVGTAGSVAYEFDNGFQNAYLTRGSKSFFLRMWRIFVNASMYAIRLFSLVMFFVIRVSFGILLVLSVILIVVLVIVAVVALLSKFMGDNDSDSDFDLSGLLYGTGHFFRYWAFDWLWDWWYWGQYLRYDPYPTYTPTSTGQYQGSPELPEKKESFLDKVFSFLFGDGDPNADLEERYWRTLGLVLKSKKGVVIAEDLAPYARVEGTGEDWVLPILVRFNGTCDVTEKGNIIYQFPSFMQNVPSVAKAANWVDDQNAKLQGLVNQSLERKKINLNAQAASSHLEEYLREIPHEFSHVTGGAKTLIISFAIFLVVGSLWLMAIAASIPILLAFSPILIATAAYGALFLIVPAIRHFVVEHINKGISERNSKRQNAAVRLRTPDPALADKMVEAGKAREESANQASAETIAYSTTEDNLEQEFKEKGLE